MKYYKILNLNRQHVGPFTASQTWLNVAQSEPNFEGSYSILGECDASGNPLEEIKENNFISKKPDTIPPVENKTAAPDDQFQSFDTTNTVINGKPETGSESGTGEKAITKKTAAGKGKSGKG